MGAGLAVQGGSIQAGQAPRAVIGELREKIRRLEAAPRPPLDILRTGVEPFDAFLGGGFPLGAAVELCGPEASGRTSLALRALATATSGPGSNLAAYVDASGQLYGPPVLAMGVSLESLLVVRPESPSQAVWSAVQLVRSGTMACVVLDLTGTGHRLSPSELKRISDAASRSGGLLLLLTSPERPGDGALRLRTESLGLRGFRVELLRSRRRGLGETVIPWEALHVRAAVWRHRPPEAVWQLPVPRLCIQRELPEDPTVERNGPVGVHGSRPGRDLSMPPLASTQEMGG